MANRYIFKSLLNKHFRVLSPFACIAAMTSWLVFLPFVFLPSNQSFIPPPCVVCPKGKSGISVLKTLRALITSRIRCKCLAWLASPLPAIHCKFQLHQIALKTNKLGCPSQATCLPRNPLPASPYSSGVACSRQPYLTSWLSPGRSIPMAILQQRLKPRSLNSKHYLLPTPQAAPASGISTQIFLLRVNPFFPQ